MTILVIVLQVDSSLGGLTSLFNRQRLFQRTPNQQPHQNQQQQQQQPQVHQPDQLIFAANSLSPNHFNPFNIRQDDLLRLNVAQKNAVKQQQLLNQQQELVALGGEPSNHISFEQAAQPDVFYKQQVNMEQAPMLTHQYSASSHFVQPLISYQKQQHHHHHNPHEQHSRPMLSGIAQASSEQHLRRPHFMSNLEHSGASQIPTGASIQPSQTEIVDKIERHIDQEIEQGLKDSSPSAAASGKGGEKESSASTSGEESEEIEEPKAEKRHEGGESKAEEHHEEHPPEAFEVHHKKGGKSFQYFHQGHHS